MRLAAEKRWAARRASIAVVESVERQIADHVPLFAGSGDTLAAQAGYEAYRGVVADRLAGR